MAQPHLSERQDMMLKTEKKTVQEIAGFADNPASVLVSQYQRIAREQMCTLPFYHPSMPILAECELFEEQWLGVVLTPWLLSVVVLPGPDQCWPVRPLASRIALQLPCGDMTFMVGELPMVDESTGRGQLLACSLMSPLDPQLGADTGRALVTNTLRMLLSLPVQQGGAVDLGRRRLFGAGRR